MNYLSKLRSKIGRNYHFIEIFSKREPFMKYFNVTNKNNRGN